MYSCENDVCDVTLSPQFILKITSISKEIDSCIFEISHTRNDRHDRIAQLAKNSVSIPKLAASLPTMARQIFQLVRCRYGLTNVCKKLSFKFQNYS